MRITVPEVVNDFKRYHASNPAWGSLHIVLEDGNFRDMHVQSCIGYAIKNGDIEGQRLGDILFDMSQTQRRKIAELC